MKNTRHQEHGEQFVCACGTPGGEALPIGGFGYPFPTLCANCQTDNSAAVRVHCATQEDSGPADPRIKCECGARIGVLTPDGQARYRNPSVCENCQLDCTLIVRRHLQKLRNAAALSKQGKGDPDEEPEESEEEERPADGDCDSGDEDDAPRPAPVSRRQQRRESPQAPNKITLLEREQAAVKMRMRGATFEEIGTKLGCTRQAAHTMVKRVLAREHAELKENAEMLIANEYRILNEMQRVIYKGALEGSLFEIDRIIRISESRRRLLGLDAPESIKIGGLDDELVSDILSDLGIGKSNAAEERLKLATKSLGEAPKVNRR
jgi:hypothetical protein